MTTSAISRLPLFGDHVPAQPGFAAVACLAAAPGAVGDCVRPSGHDGPHQGAQGWAWDDAPRRAQHHPLCDAELGPDFTVSPGAVHMTMFVCLGDCWDERGDVQ